MSQEHAPRIENKQEKAVNKELHELGHELERRRHEQAEHARSHHEQELTEARQSVKTEAISGEEIHRPQSETRQTAQIRTKADRLHSFDTTMHHVRKDLSAPERAFSTFIHNPTIEKISDVAGKTVARPSGVAGAAIAALVGLSLVYGIAKFAGFALSGSEMPLLLAAGFVAGLLLEWVFKAVRSLLLPRKS